MIDIQELLQQEISRKEFLRYIGVALLSVIGVASFLSSLTDSFSKPAIQQQAPKEIGGYGATPYGR